MKHSYWLGDDTSALRFLETEARIDKTPAKDLQDMEVRAAAEALADGGEFGEFSHMVTLAGNLAIVDVSGSLVSRDSPINKFFGLVSYNEIRNAVFAATDHPEVEGIVINMDTPGGQATGISDLSDFLTQVDANVKPVYTYAGTTMASGGYWLGSVGREIYASRLATVGSIGVITMHASVKELLEKMGVEVTVLRAGEFKALGSPYEKLDDKARAQIESQLNSIYDVFLQTVAENRGTSVKALKETAAEGRLFIGTDAVPVGLVDHIASFDMAMSMISKKVSSSSNRSPSSTISNPQTGVIDMPGKRKVLTEAGVAAIESGVPEAEVYSNPEMVAEAEEEGAEPQEPVAAAEESADEGEDSQASAQPSAPEETGEGAALVDKMFTRISDLTVELANTKAQLVAAERAREAAASTESALVSIAVQAIQKMQVSLGGVPMKLSDASASVVLEQYNRTHTQFNQRFKVGSTAQVPQDKDFQKESEGAQENVSLASAVHRLTTSKVRNK